MGKAIWYFAGGVTLLSALAVMHEPLQSPAAVATDTADVSMAAKQLQLPLQFEPNRGQLDAATQFLAHGQGYTLALQPAAAILHLKSSGDAAGAQLRMQLRGANPDAAFSGAEPLPGTANYFIGNDPAQWRTAIPTYARVRQDQVYPGIDLVYYGRQRQLEYDFELAPGADPAQIRLAYDGIEGMHLNDNGDLVLKVAGGVVLQQRPVVFQQGPQGREPVDGRYVVAGNTVGFELGDYDSDRALVIDPVLSYSTYLGGVAGDDLFAMVATADGVIVTGTGGCQTSGGGPQSFPTTEGAFDVLCRGNEDAYVAKLNADGSALLFSSYIGGNSDDQGHAVAVDADGNVYVGGAARTDGASGFPVTTGAYDTTGDLGEGFIVKLSADGTQLLYGSYIGGSGSFDFVHGLALDDAGAVYLTGQTDNRGTVKFPATPGTVQTTPAGDYDAFVAKMHLEGNGAADLQWATLLGGSATEQGNKIAVDASGVYVAGITAEDFSTRTPTQFPTSANAYSRVWGGGLDAFLTKLSLDGTQLLYSTLLGSRGADHARGLAIDAAGNAYIGGSASRTGTFPTTPGAYDTTQDDNGDDGFVAKFNPNLAGAASLVWSSLLGASAGDESVEALAIDANGNVVVTGYTANGSGTEQFPATPGAFANLPQGASSTSSESRDGFLTILSADGSKLVYSSYYGGALEDHPRTLAIDADGNIHFGGLTRSINLPTSDDGSAYQTSNRGSSDSFVTRFGAIADASAQFTDSEYSVPEDAGRATISVTRLGSSDGPFQVDYRAVSGTAHAGGDFRQANGTLSWLDGESGSKSFDVVIIDNDAYNEGDAKTVLLRLSAPTGRLGTPFEAVLSIVDDEEPPSPGTLQFTATDHTVDENIATGVARIFVSRLGGSAGAVSVTFATVDGTATAGQDYTATTQVVTFADGESASQAVDVPIIDDTLDEPLSEAVNLRLSNPTGGATLGNLPTSLLTIIDNDAAPEVSFVSHESTASETDGTVQLSLSLSTASGRTVTVPFTTGGSATAAADYNVTGNSVTFAPGETTRTIAVSLIDDALVETDETAEFTLGTPTNASRGEINRHTLNITSDDVAAVGTLQFSVSAYSVAEQVLGGQATITVTRNGGSAGAVSVQFASSNGTATAGQDYTATAVTVNFADGDSTPKTVLVPIVNDQLDEADETVQLALSAPTGGATLGAIPAATLTIIDDDEPFEPGTIQFGAVDFSVNENAGPGSVTVTRSGGSSGAASVQFSTFNDSAQAPGDYAETIVTLNWADGDAAPKTIDIPIVDDALVEGAERISLNLSNVTGASIGTPSAGFLNIVDDDLPPAESPGSLQFSAPTLVVSEGTPQLVILVNRVNGSDGDVTVRFATANGSATGNADYGTLAGTLSWQDGESEQQVIPLGIIDDALVEGAETFSVTLSQPTGGAMLGTPSTLTVTITDNDGGTLAGKSGGGAFGPALLAVLALFGFGRRLSGAAARGALLALGLLASPASQAGDETGGWYAGLRAGPASNERDGGDLTAALRRKGHEVTARADDSDWAGTIYLGRQVAPWLALELGWFDLGDYEATVSGSAGSMQQLAQDAAADMPGSNRGAVVALRPSLRLGERFAIDFRGGAVYGRQHSRISGAGVSATFKQNDFGLMGGVGLRYRITSSLHLGAGIESYPANGGSRIYPAYGLIEYRFGSAAP